MNLLRTIGVLACLVCPAWAPAGDVAPAVQKPPQRPEAALNALVKKGRDPGPLKVDFGDAARLANDISYSEVTHRFQTPGIHIVTACCESQGKPIMHKQEVVVAQVPFAAPVSQKPHERSVRIAGIVLKWIRADKEANFRRAEPMIRQAAAGGAQIVCTTECFLDGYAIADKSIPLDVYRSLGEAIPEGTYFKRLAALARELKVVLVAGMLEADGEARYNTAVLISPEGNLLGKYRKQHLEHELVRNRPGTSSSVFETPYGRVGLLICADRRLPEIAGRMKQGGAELLICPSGGMFGAKSNDWILQARSRETGLPIVFVHPAEFLVTGPDGSVLQQTVLGDILLVSPADAGASKDANRVFYFDLPLRRIGAG